MAGTRKLKVLRECKYGRNSVTMKCYKKGEKGSTAVERAVKPKGEKVERVVKPNATAKAKRDCKYGRNSATNKCYTKAERAKIDKEKKPASVAHLTQTPTPKNILKMESQKSITENGKQMITAVAASNKQLITANGKKVKFWDINSDSVEFAHVEQGQKNATIKKVAITDNNAISITDTVITWNLKLKIMGNYFKTEKNYFDEILTATISDKYLAVFDNNKHRKDSYIEIYGHSSKLGICLDDRDNKDDISYKYIVSLAIHGDLLFSIDDQAEIIVWDLSKYNNNNNRTFHSIKKIKGDDYSSLLVHKDKLFARMKTGVKVWKISGHELHLESTVGSGHNFDAFAVSDDYVFTLTKKSKKYEISAYEISNNALAATVETTLSGNFVDLVASNDRLFLASSKEVLVWKF